MGFQTSPLDTPLKIADCFNISGVFDLQSVSPPNAAEFKYSGMVIDTCYEMTLQFGWCFKTFYSAD